MRRVRGYTLFLMPLCSSPTLSVPFPLLPVCSLAGLNWRLPYRFYYFFPFYPCNPTLSRFPSPTLGEFPGMICTPSPLSLPSLFAPWVSSPYMARRVFSSIGPHDWYSWLSVGFVPSLKPSTLFLRCHGLTSSPPHPLLRFLPTPFPGSTAATLVFNPAPVVIASTFPSPSPTSFPSSFAPYRPWDLGTGLGEYTCWPPASVSSVSRDDAAC